MARLNLKSWSITLEVVGADEQRAIGALTEVLMSTAQEHGWHVESAYSGPTYEPTTPCPSCGGEAIEISTLCSPVPRHRRTACTAEFDSEEN